MSFIHDFIMESHTLEDEELYKQIVSNKPKKDKKAVKETIVKKETPIQECDTIKECDEQKTPVKEQVLEESTMVDIEDYLDERNYVKSIPSITEGVQEIELPDRPQKGKPGSPEYEANEKRRKREAAYRKYARIDEDFEITEDNLVDWAFKRVCMEFRCDPARLLAELLHQMYTGLERY